jgi:hypothetical protein
MIGPCRIMMFSGTIGTVMSTLELTTFFPPGSEAAMVIVY